MDFYKILLELMDELNLSIPEIARKSNLADSTVRSIINRKSKSVALDVAVKISKGLGISLDRLNGQSTNIEPLSIYAMDEDSEVLDQLDEKQITEYLNEITSLPKDALGELRIVLDYLKFKYKGGDNNVQ